jgi:hydroxyacylglutathione hydrolase
MLQITPVPAFRDNYIWVIHARRGQEHRAVLVDPGEPEAILSWLASQVARPVAVLVTHHHGDHTGALPALSARWPMPVYGPEAESISGVTHPVREGSVVDIPELALTFRVMATPGHTRGHVCYFGHGWLFSGDTLFSCGCGRLFEGSAEDMHASLRRLARLPEETQVFCAHEYTLANIGFALEVEDGNPALEARHLQARRLRKAGQPTLPSTMAQELATNPFLRCHVPALRVAISHHAGSPVNSEVAAFARLRQWKDGD